MSIIKETVQRAMESRYGFKPSKNSIVIMAYNDSHTHIEFHVRGALLHF